MIKLRYRNTNTFFLCGNAGNLLIDTDYAGMLPVFYKEIKKKVLLRLLAALTAVDFFSPWESTEKSSVRQAIAQIAFP